MVTKFIAPSLRTSGRHFLCGRWSAFAAIRGADREDATRVHQHSRRASARSRCPHLGRASPRAGLFWLAKSKLNL